MCKSSIILRGVHAEHLPREIFYTDDCNFYIIHRRCLTFDCIFSQPSDLFGLSESEVIPLVSLIGGETKIHRIPLLVKYYKRVENRARGSVLVSCRRWCFFFSYKALKKKEKKSEKVIFLFCYFFCWQLDILRIKTFRNLQS